jgi:histidine triad (HIT) family protein
VPTIFTRIIEGELPGRIIYRDDQCAAFLTIEPLRPGHTLVVPIAEVDDWLDLDPDLAAHLMMVAQRIGKAIDVVWKPTRVAMMIVGLEVPHVHIHITGIDSERDLDFSLVDRNASATSLDDAAERVRRVLDG